MTRDEIQAEFDRFIEFPEGSPRTMVTVASTLFFAEHIARMATSSEREACAKVCETAIWSKNVQWWMEVTKTEVSAEAGRQCAAAIRARSQK